MRRPASGWRSGWASGSGSSPGGAMSRSSSSTSASDSDRRPASASTIIDAIRPVISSTGPGTIPRFVSFQKERKKNEDWRMESQNRSSALGKIFQKGSIPWNPSELSSAAKLQFTEFYWVSLGSAEHN